MRSQFLSPAIYRLLFSLLAVVYVAGLFVPLMDNDSAHHANIALRMYLTGDYVNLIDHGKDYLDKPHLHFWLAALSYHIFGVTTFAYKFPSFLFTILGTYSTYRLGKALYNKDTGQLAALLVASAFAYILANNDVRMDAILTACITFSIWQAVEWVQNRKLISVLGVALGVALGFATKGHIAVITPAVAAVFYIAYKKEWQLFWHPHLLVMIAAFFIFISPVVYCYYLQFDLHPEKIIRGKSNRSGVEFILWKQSIERFEGESFGADSKNDYLFFIHSFLWAFAPWSILAFVAFVRRLSSFKNRSYEWLTTGTFAVIMIIISASGFKLPHYLNIIFPVAAVFTASWLLVQVQNKSGKSVWITQLIVCSLLLLLALIVNVWAFPLQSFWKIAVALCLLAVAVYFLLNNTFTFHQRAVATSVSVMIFLFFLLNTNFYPKLLQYQGGNELAAVVNKHISGSNVYFWNNTYSSSLNFYTKTLRQPFHDSLLPSGKKVWLVAGGNEVPQIAQKYQTGKSYRHADYEITQLQWEFINPATRPKAVGTMWLIEISGIK